MVRVFTCFLLALLAAPAWAQTPFVISGTVTDAAGEPLPGVTVRLRYVGRGTITDVEGQYRIRVPGDTTVLEFSFVGMEPVARRADQNPLNVVLQETSQYLDEVVVTGYGETARRRDAVGSLEQIDAEELMPGRPIESFDRMLEGLVAGVQVNTNTGEPGVPISVRIRGSNSLPQTTGATISSSGEPLYVLNGVPLYDIQEQQSGGQNFNEGNLAEQRLNPLAGINPEDIASITVLKDAAATAIYGANAANGVVLITTKSGKAGPTRINVSAQYGVQEVLNRIRFTNSEQYLELYRETLINSGSTPEEADEFLVETGNDPSVDTDWEGLIFRPATNLSTNVSVSGGAENTTFRISGGYQLQQAVTEGNDFARVSLRANIRNDWRERLNTDFDLGFSYNTKRGFELSEFISVPPTLAPFAPDGSFNRAGAFGDIRANPLAILAQNENINRGVSGTTSLRLSYRLRSDLTLSTTLGADYYQNRRFLYLSSRNPTGARRGGFATRFDRNNLRWISFTQLRWNRTFADRHQVSALVGFEAQEKTTYLLRLIGRNFPFDGLRQIGVQDREDIDGASSENQEAQLSFYARLSYDYRSKFFLSLNGRQDAASVFGGDAQVARFGSVGGAWVLTEEPWLRDVARLDLLKLRATVGTTGNSRIGSYASRGLYTFGSSFAYAGENGSAATTAPNPDLTWELTHKYNVGLDAQLFGRLSLTLERYLERTFGAIGSLDIPAETGFSSVTANVSDLRNSGWELTINSDNLTGRVKWRTSFNVAYNRNEITRVLNDQQQETGFTSLAGVRVGEDVTTLYAADYIGIDPYNGKRLFRLPDGSITDDNQLARRVENRVPVGKGAPDFFGGLTNVISYRNFELSGLVTYSYGGQIIAPSRVLLTSSDGRNIEFFNADINQLRRWQQPGDITDTPQLLERGVSVSRSSTRFVYNNSYLSFANVRLAYVLPPALVRKWGLQNLAASAQVNNLGFLNLVRDTDEGNGLDEYRVSFPQGRALTVGLQVGL